MYRLAALGNDPRLQMGTVGDAFPIQLTIRHSKVHSMGARP